VILLTLGLPVSTTFSPAEVSSLPLIAAFSLALGNSGVIDHQGVAACAVGTISIANQTV